MITLAQSLLPITANIKVEFSVKAQILTEMKVLKTIDPEFEVQRRVAFIKSKLDRKSVV